MSLNRNLSAWLDSTRQSNRSPICVACAVEEENPTPPAMDIASTTASSLRNILPIQQCIMAACPRVVAEFGRAAVGCYTWSEALPLVLAKGPNSFLHKPHAIGQPRTFKRGIDTKSAANSAQRISFAIRQVGRTQRLMTIRTAV